MVWKFVIALVLLGLAVLPARAASPCSEMPAADPSDQAGIPARILEAAVVPAAQGLPAYCAVKGYANPQVGFEILLPISTWNGKFIHLGSDGHGGLTFSRTYCDFALRRGYACLTSDMGHLGRVTDAAWAQNNLQAKVDWGYRATHVATLTGKAVVSRFYGRAPAYAYFRGCSTGGRQALQAAQLFPHDFDGIIASCPPIRLSEIYVTRAWERQTFYDAEGRPRFTPDELALVEAAALKACDLDDGLSDGVVGDPLNCRFKPTALVCAPGQVAGCLGPAKAALAEKLFTGPTDAEGRPHFGGWILPGMELRGLATPMPAWIETFMGGGLRSVFSSPERDAGWGLGDVDVALGDRPFEIMQALYDSSNPDLTRFRRAGGKLIIAQGANDPGVLLHRTVDYYEKVERVMGGRLQTQAFVRLFVLPGVGHCFGGPGADVVDFLTALEDWVERGKAPDRLVAHHLRSSWRLANNFNTETSFPLPQEDVVFSRPVFPYPMVSVYGGRGDASRAANWRSRKGLSK